MSDTKSLKSLGSKTKYYNKPNIKILETVKNLHKGQLYLIPFVQERDEFTSLCPMTKQPDHASIEIVYIPNEKMIESKSLKLYLFSFRNQGEFHEDICNRIANDLVKVLDPFYLRVYGNFAPRGGLAIKPIVEKWQEMSSGDKSRIMWIVRSFDLKK